MQCMTFESLVTGGQRIPVLSDELTEFWLEATQMKDVIILFLFYAVAPTSCTAQTAAWVVVSCWDFSGDKLIIWKPEAPALAVVECRVIFNLLKKTREEQKCLTTPWRG